MADNNGTNTTNGGAEQDGIDTSRPAEIIPDSMLIGGARNGKRPAAPAAPKAQAPAEGADELDGEALDAADAADGEGGTKDIDSNGGDAAGAAGDDKQIELTDEDLIDVLLESGADMSGQPIRQINDAEVKPLSAKPMTADDLEPGLKAEYDAAVEKFGPDLANTILLPRLKREQALQTQMAPVLKAHADQYEQAQAKAAQQVIGFFTEKAKAGYKQVYGEGPGKSSPIQTEAMKRVIAKAVQIKNQVEANGLTITPERALERAHAMLWKDTTIGRAVAARQSTMQTRANNTAMPTNRNAAGASSSVPAGTDPYAKVKAALNRAGIAR